MYHSHVDEVADTNAGLVGGIVVTRCGEARADGSPKDVDREVVALFTVLNENESPYLEETMSDHNVSAPLDDDGFLESNLMHSVNGFVYGNLPGLTLQAGQHVRWYTMALGTEVDLHTPHWHGQTLTQMGMRTDATELLPGSMRTLDMVPDEPGTWLFHCHVNDHIKAGMQALYTVRPRAA
jgi:manganese oxidase